MEENANTSQDNTTQPPAVEPVEMGIDQLSQIEGQEVGVVSAPATQVNQAVATPKKPRRWLRVLLWALVAAFVVAGICLAIYFFTFRTPNGVYDAAIKDLQTMKIAAQTIKKNSHTDRNLTDVDSKNLLESSREPAKQYVASLASLQKNAAIKDDIYVKATYAGAVSVVEPYGQATLDAADTFARYSSVKTECDTAIQTYNQAMGPEQYNKDMAKCRELLSKYTSMPAASFSKWYENYRSALLSMLDAAGAYYQAVASNSPEQVAAYTKALAAIKRYQLTVAQQATITNVADADENPSEKIDDVIKVLQQRRDVFFRW